MGRVESVNLGTRPDGEPAVKVVLVVDEDVQKRIRADSTASIGTIGLLGDRYVEISLGSPNEPILEDGAEIRIANPANIARVIDTGTQALDNIATLAKNLNAVVDGLPGRARTDKGLASSVASVGDILSEIQHGDGLLHSLIYDEYEGGGVASIEKSLVTLEGILDEVATGNGLLHSLVYEPLTEQDVVLEALDAGARLNSILAKIDTGEGTLGLLAERPSLYEDLKQLVGGAERSTLVKTLIQMSGEEKRWTSRPRWRSAQTRSWSLATAREMVSEVRRLTAAAVEAVDALEARRGELGAGDDAARAALEQELARAVAALGARDGGARRGGEGPLARRLRQRARLLLLALARGAARILPRLRRGLRGARADSVDRATGRDHEPRHHARAIARIAAREPALARGVGRVAAHEPRLEAAGVVGLRVAARSRRRGTR